MAPDGQARPHMPQLSVLVSSVTHAPLQTDWPVGQFAVQAPAWQVSPAAHALPHAPQFAGSTFESTHLLPHAVCVA